MKILTFTDIHFGAKTEFFDQLCVDFVQFVAEQAEENQIDAIIFMGDWFDNRSTISTKTLEYSLRAIEILSKLNIPIHFIVGNHDLALRNSRDIFSTRIFHYIDNITVYDKPEEIAEGIVVAPYLFPEEYQSFFDIYDYANYIFGHFEFNGASLTRYNDVFDHGYSIKYYGSIKKIFSGHFHRRQVLDNVIVYTGNCFPIDFRDANDFEKGIMIFDSETGKYFFKQWEKQPIFIESDIDKLSEIKELMNKRTNLKILINKPVDFKKVESLVSTLSEKINTVIVEETFERKRIIEQNDTPETEINENASIENTILQLISTIDVETVDKNLMELILKEIMEVEKDFV